MTIQCDNDGCTTELPVKYMTFFNLKHLCPNCFNEEKPRGQANNSPGDAHQNTDGVPA